MPMLALAPGIALVPILALILALVLVLILVLVLVLVLPVVLVVVRPGSLLDPLPTLWLLRKKLCLPSQITFSSLPTQGIFHSKLFFFPISPE